MHGRPWPLEDAEYDVVIVGGGMAGAGVARELALRGVSVALVEKGDFASATTSQSSKLIHGGLRYLELFDFGLVQESLRERETLRRLAPHLVRPLPFLVPIYRESSRSLIKVRIGLKLYDWLTPGRKRERYRVLPAVDALSLEPALRAGDLRGAGYYFDDLLVFPERLCLENILSACRLGARAFNYAQVAELTRDRRGAITGVRARDLLTGRVATLGARIVVNATGPWVDELRAAAGVSERGPQILRRTKGIHCLLPRLTDHAIYHSTDDDRMIFVIPWREFSLIGATDTDFNGDLERLHATGDEVAYLSPTSHARTRSSPRSAGASCRSPARSSRASGAWPKSWATRSWGRSAVAARAGATGSPSTAPTTRPRGPRRTRGSTSRARRPPPGSAATRSRPWCRCTAAAGLGCSTSPGRWPAGPSGCALPTPTSSPSCTTRCRTRWRSRCKT